MRIHSNVILDQATIRDALVQEIEAGRIARSVMFKTLTAHRSQSHVAAFEVQLDSYRKIEGDGRRAGNSGSYGAMRSEEDGYAATYDEWGWLISALYRIDPAAVWGGVKHPIYADRDDFNTQTGRWYDLGLADEIAADEDIDPMPWVSTGYNANADKAMKARPGRIGAVRRYSDADRDGLGSYARYTVFAPRTAEQVRAFGRLASPVGIGH